ncbi:Nudix family hydrolase [Neptuniibacter marinus]|uniref:Nudix family hydrolase n=1 Tax=Neptuniibacter marinus TaxID=1806670 RepID=UPI00082A3E9A|nr:Nudix family hydrolase [Neptuniibacter marinus]
MKRKLIHVAAAVIKNSAGEVLIARRSEDQHQGGLWEFPGGKVEQGESALTALSRELNEEIGIEVKEARPLIKVPYHYSDKSVLLDVFEVSAFDGEAWGKEGQPIRWVAKGELDSFAFPAANKPILNACLLPKLIAITPNLSNVDTVVHFVEQALSNGAEGIMLRNHDLAVDTFDIVYKRIKKLLAGRSIPLIVNSSIEVAEALNADALHLSSLRLTELKQRNQFSGRWLSASCHNPEQMAMAVDKGLDFVTLSPVLKTQSHPQAVPLGWELFQQMVSDCSIPVYALGGVDSRLLDKAVSNGAQGVAGISAWSQDLEE